MRCQELSGIIWYGKQAQETSWSTQWREWTTESGLYIRVWVRNRWSKALTFTIRDITDDQSQQPSDYMNSRKMMCSSLADGGLLAWICFVKGYHCGHCVMWLSVLSSFETDGCLYTLLGYLNLDVTDHWSFKLLKSKSDFFFSYWPSILSLELKFLTAHATERKKKIQQLSPVSAQIRFMAFGAETGT